MGTLAASVYLLTCCRPNLNSSFCYRVETPKFINLNSYHEKFIYNSSKCINHEKLYDHSINFYNSCTDCRAWSLDDGQRKRHFFDIISRHIPHCGEEKHSIDEHENINKPEKYQVKVQEISAPLSTKDTLKERVQETESPEPTPSKREVPKVEVVKEEVEDFKPDEIATLLEDISGNVPPPVGDSSTLSDEILDKLDCNLSNLEKSFDKFVQKNRSFIENLVESLNFEKQRQVELKHNHCKVKQENDILRTKNEYLKMVNAKQVEYFKNELEKAISENKTCFLKQVHHLERIINCNKEELQYYKKNETKLLKIVENEKMELHKLKNDINILKCKEINIIKQYVKLLNFLEDVKKTLDNCGDGRDGSHFQRSSHTISGSGEFTSLIQVLRNALYNGIESLNVRDLSILHDSIQELNERLCHQNEFCGRNPMMCTNISDQMFYDEYDNYCPSTDYIHKGIQDYESSLSIVPSRQGPEKTSVYCPPR